MMNSRSVERTSQKGGNFQNKLAQLARSPQIFKKKQQILNQKDLELRDEIVELNKDLMPLMKQDQEQDPI